MFTRFSEKILNWLMNYSLKMQNCCLEYYLWLTVPLATWWKGWTKYNYN